MSELFDIPENLSPRLKWIRQHDVHTHETDLEEDPWAAWIGGPENLTMGRYVTAETEQEAIEKLAVRHNLKLWNQ